MDDTGETKVWGFLIGDPDEIPGAEHAHTEACAAFRKHLAQLFDEYSVKLAPYEAKTWPVTPKQARAEALDLLASPTADPRHVQEAAYLACDTGAPNGMVLGMYMLLFI
jgi:hypothetical protein